MKIRIECLNCKYLIPRDECPDYCDYWKKLATDLGCELDIDNFSKEEIADLYSIILEENCCYRKRLQKK